MNTELRLTVDEIRLVFKGLQPIPKGVTVIVPQCELVKHYPDRIYKYGAKAVVLSEPVLPIPEIICVIVDGENIPINVAARRLLL